MNSTAVIGIILIAVFVIVMLLTFVFHVLVFKALLIIRDIPTVDTYRNEPARTVLDQTWTT
ncbi:MAG TPA: hypothetical protein VH500_23625 [Nitrososphaeraceae archaeon]|jgi:hypothetical protein